MDNTVILNKAIKDKKKLEQKTATIFSKVAEYFDIKEVPKISVLFHTSRTSYNKSIGRQTQVWEVGNSSSDGKINIVHPDYFEKISSHKNSEFDQILAHEIAHAFIGKISSGKMVPVWLNEGLAMNIAGQFDKYKSGKPMCIEENFSRKLAPRKDWDKRTNYDAYKLSCLFTAFLIERYSINKVLEIVGKLDENYYAPSFENKILHILGKPIADLENEFIPWVEKIS